MKPTTILKSACTVIGATTLGVAVSVLAIHALASFELLRIER